METRSEELRQDAASYEPPKVEVLGDLAELTLGTSGPTGTDAALASGP